MKKYKILLVSLIGAIGFFTGCEKDETKTILSENPIPANLITIPDLTLEAAHETDTLVFVGTPVNPGFQASAGYFLEACVSGANFTPASAVMRVYFGIQDTLMIITEKALNTMFVKKIPAGTPSAVDFRIRAVLKLDAGTGALGSSANPLEVTSEITTVTAVTY